MIGAGFAEPVVAAQRHFRVLLDAMAHPGRVAPLAGELPTPPAPLSPGAFALGLTLLDYETPVWIDPSTEPAAAVASLRFACGCPIVDAPDRAAFAFVPIASRLPPLAAFGQGTPEYPDRSTTVVVEVEGLIAGQGTVLRGPGIDGELMLAVAGVRGDFWDEVRRNRQGFPQGVDLVLVCGDRVACLPRSTIVGG